MLSLLYRHRQRSRSTPYDVMAHLAPSWPDQVLCKENKRKALLEQQRRWMQQRDLELSHPSASEDDDFDMLEDINGFLADVGRTLDGYGASERLVTSVDSETSSLRGALMPPVAVASSLPGGPPPVRSQRRSAAQRAAAERLVQPQKRLQDAAVPASLIGSEDFYKYQQEGICQYRTAYNARVGAHYEAVASGTDTTIAPPAPVDSIGALAHENTSRHVAPISQNVHSSSDWAGSMCRRPRDGAAMVGFTSGKTAGRRGGRIGRSDSIHAALQAAKDRGPML